MVRLSRIIIAVTVFVFLQAGYLWAVRPLSEDAEVKPEKIEKKQESAARTGFEHTAEPAPPEVIKRIEMERELKREVIQRKREEEQEIAEKFKEVIVKEAPIEKSSIEGLPAKQCIASKEPIPAGHSRISIILLIPLILIALGLVYHIYRRKD